MAKINTALAKDTQVRALLYGQAMTRKTWWALRAAEEGFNIIYWDFDANYQVANNLSEEARDRISIIDARLPGETVDNNGALLLAKCLEASTNLLYDEQTRRYVAASKVEAEKEYLKINLYATGPHDILVIDTWTALQTALIRTQKTIVDPTMVAKLEWDDYNKLRLLDDIMLDNIRRLPCHVVVIGHEETYAKKRPDANPQGKPHEIIESVRQQVSSASRAHGETMPAKFTDVLHFSVKTQGGPTTLSTRGSTEVDAGSRRFAPGNYAWDKFKFGDLVPDQIREAAKTSQPSAALQYITGQEVMDARSAAPAVGVISTGVTAILNRKA